MLDISTKLLYYKREEIQRAILDSCIEREVGIRYGEGFGKRPDVLMYANDVIEAAKKGATSFHISEERWSSPLSLSPGLPQKELDSLRIGWDLVLDIDCPFWFFSKLTAHLFIKALKAHHISSISCKFSGNKGFHIAVPLEAFPIEINNQPIKNWFPQGPRVLASYLLNFIGREEWSKRRRERLCLMINSPFLYRNLQPGLGWMRTA